jgi:hypothetical protein
MFIYLFNLYQIKKQREIFSAITTKDELFDSVSLSGRWRGVMMCHNWNSRLQNALNQ